MHFANQLSSFYDNQVYWLLSCMNIEEIDTFFSIAAVSSTIFHVTILQTVNTLIAVTVNCKEDLLSLVIAYNFRLKSCVAHIIFV